MWIMNSFTIVFNYHLLMTLQILMYYVHWWQHMMRLLLFIIMNRSWLLFKVDASSDNGNNENAILPNGNCNVLSVFGVSITDDTDADNDVDIVVIFLILILLI